MPTHLITIIERCTARAIVMALIVAASVASFADEPTPAKSSKLDFRRDVFPILSRRCWECHLGGDASGGIRLDVREEWLGETSGRPLVVIGKSAKSRVIEVVEARDPKIVMPAEGERLKPAEIATLRKWIDEGLAWDDELLPTPKVMSNHWAFHPIVADASRIRTNRRTRDASPTNNPIDAFITSLADEAERHTLIRRLSLDLLGLPPTHDDVEDFVADTRPDAYEQLADRLLASPAYGERWARHWLDVARWAESEGYESNHPRPFAWQIGRAHV